MLWNPTHPVAGVFAREAELAARALGIRLRFFEARDPKHLDTALANIEKDRSAALLVIADPIFFTQRKLIADFAIRQRLPSTFLFREFAEAGGLMSYGPSIRDSHRRAGIYVDKILKGAKPSDLTVEQPTKYELVINLNTAKQIGVTIPPMCWRVPTESLSSIGSECMEHSVSSPQGDYLSRDGLKQIPVTQGGEP